MIMRLLGLVIAMALLAGLLGSCRADEQVDDVVPLGPGAETPEESVELLMTALDAGDFSAAARWAMPEQGALAALAEGATFAEVADVLRTRDPAVSANFWAGFAQGAGSFLIGTMPTGTEVIERDGIDYHIVTVAAESGVEREIVTRESDGFRIDLFASFAPGLAERMIGPVERLLAARTADSRLLLAELGEAVPSLLLAAERPGQPPDVIQAVLRLVELITRIG